MWTKIVSFLGKFNKLLDKINHIGIMVIVFTSLYIESKGKHDEAMYALLFAITMICISISYQINKKGE